jgi:hypothetical protein
VSTHDAVDVEPDAPEVDVSGDPDPGDPDEPVDWWRDDAAESDEPPPHAAATAASAAAPSNPSASRRETDECTAP